MALTVVCAVLVGVVGIASRAQVAALVLAGCNSAPAPDAQKAAATSTEILWDKYGVPHIFAPDHPSLFQAYGYAQMEAHSELLIRLYAQARGRGAEFYGEQYLEADRWVRTNGIPETARQWTAGQNAGFAPLIQAFAAGLNAWATEHTAELSPAAQAVLPLTAEDVYAHCLRVIHYDWIINPAKLETRLRRAEAEVHGSNEWAIGPSKSATGKAMLSVFTPDKNLLYQEIINSSRGIATLTRPDGSESLLLGDGGRKVWNYEMAK